MDKKLKSLCDAGRIPHTLIIDGGAFEDRLLAAKEVARALFCESSDKPCGTCVHCKRIENDSFPDVTYINPDSGKTFISVGILREMVADTHMRPHESDRKVYIIPRAEAIELKTQNTLLKVLEEPAGNITFMLLCPSHSVFLPTILSRAAVFSLQDNESEDEFSQEAMDAAIGIADALSQRNEAELVIRASAFDPTSDKKFQNLKPAIDYLGLIVRDALILSESGGPALSTAAPQAEALCKAFSKPELLNTLEALKELKHSAEIHGNKNLITARISSLLMTATTGGNT